PFFTANTSISFNWGGVSGKVGKAITTLKTRTHNEIVVDSLEYYVNYFKEGRFDKVEVYKQTPFRVVLDKSKPQVLNMFLGIRILDTNTFEVFFDNTSAATATGQRYDTNTKLPASLPTGLFTQKFTFGVPVNLACVHVTLETVPGKNLEPGAEFFIQFLNFDSVVNTYQKGIIVEPYSNNSSSVLVLSLAGLNKTKIVDYLNTTSAVLSKTELERKNQYATNTVKFIDSTLAAVNTDLKDVYDEMDSFRKQNHLVDVNAEMMEVSQKLTEFEKLKKEEETKLSYLRYLEEYLQTKTSYANIAAPSSVGITESNILSSVGKITALAIERQNLEYTTQESSDLFKDIDRQINAEKNVLLETITATKRISSNRINSINGDIAALEAKLSTLPENQQEYLKIQRKLEISQEA